MRIPAGHVRNVLNLANVRLAVMVEAFVSRGVRESIVDEKMHCSERQLYGSQWY